jgi:hypothetical protein
MKLDDWPRRADELVKLGEEVVSTEDGDPGFRFVDNQLFSKCRSAALSFLRNSYSHTHPYYTDFDTNVRVARRGHTQTGNRHSQRRAEGNGGRLAALREGAGVG